MTPAAKAKPVQMLWPPMKLGECPVLVFTEADAQRAADWVVKEFHRRYRVQQAFDNARTTTPTQEAKRGE